MKYLFVHQSSELYGSDRSFMTVVQSVLENDKDAKIDIILPDLDGPLIDCLKSGQVNFIVDAKGYLRKIFLKKPALMVFNLFSSILWQIKVLKRYDVVYINTVVCLASIIASRFSRNNFVHVREIPVGLVKYFFKFALWFSRASLIFNSNASKEAMGLQGMVVYNGIAKGKKYPINLISAGEGGVRNKFLLIGRISEWKGQAFVIDCLRKIDYPVELIVLGGVAPGRDSYAEQIKKKSASLKSHKIQFVDFSDDPGIYYSWCDFVLVPSLLPEPFGRVAVEAMAYNKIPLVSNHGGLSEIVSDKNSGVTFSPGNEDAFISAVDYCINMSNTEYISRVNLCSKIYLERFSEDSYKEKMFDILTRGGINAF